MCNSRSLAIFLCFVLLAAGQTENPDGLGSCNVVCNCNSGPPSDSCPGRELRQGAPGKIGPMGDVGPAGMKGDKGDVGMKGQKGKDADEVLISHILGAISATSCQDLKNTYQATRPGYYVMRVEGNPTPQYIYCDFRIYTGVSTCDQLVDTYNISHSGYYILDNNKVNSSFQFCEETFVGISTCQALRDRHPRITQSKYYKLKPVSYSDSFQVYCDFAQSQVATVVHHDNMNETKISPECETPGCFKAAPMYFVNETKIRQIIDNSISCRQFVKLRCRGVQLRRNNYGWWVSQDGVKMTYWGGATTADHCACGESDTCIDNTFKCNCDNNSGARIVTDEGFLADKSKLPLRQINIGDMGGSDEEAWYMIGKLECFGQVR